MPSAPNSNRKCRNRILKCRICETSQRKCKNAVLKATNVDGVYDSDPRTNDDAKRFEKITYDEVLRRELRVMDLTAIVLAKEQSLPLIVFDLKEAGAMRRIVAGEMVGTKVAG